MASTKDDLLDPSSVPDPLTPPDCDLRDFRFTPIFRSRLFGSSFHARATDSEWRAGVTLWLKSYDQVPAGSLPDDDIDLCRIAELGRDMKSWKKIREGALHGWIKCKDDRLYHHVVAENVLEAWRSKLEQRWRTECGRIKKHNQRYGLSLEIPEFHAWMSQERPKGKSLFVPGDKPFVPRDKPLLSPGQNVQVPMDNTGSSPPCPAIFGSKRQREGQGQGELTTKSTPSVKTADAVSTGGGGDSTQQANGIASTPTPETPPASDSAPVQALIPTVDPPPDDPIPPCPQQKILELYAMILPMLRKPRIWDDKREALLRARWRYCAQGNGVFDGYRTVQDGLAFWERFFRYVAKSPKLTHGIPRNDGSVWLPDLPWLLKAENFTKVIEKKYHGN